MNRSSRIWTLGLTTIVLAAATSSNAFAERWTSLHSSRTVEAQFIGLWGESVILQLEDERRVTVNINELVAESRILARELGERQRQRREELVDGIRSDAAAESAPAPDPLPRPRTPPAYQQYSGGDGLLERLEWLEEQTNNGHVIALFDCLPASYQSDIDQLAKKAAGKANQSAASKGITAIHSIGDLIVTRQRWLFSHPRIEAIPDEASGMLKEGVLAFGGLIRDGLDPDEFSLEKLQQTSLRGWLMGFDNRIAPYLLAIQDLVKSTGVPQASFKVLSETAEGASVSVGVGPGQQVFNVIRVDGAWVPAQWAPAEWSKMVQDAHATLDQIPDGSLGNQAAVAPFVIGPYVEPAMSAASARDLHAVMDQWFDQVIPMVQMAAQMAGAQMGGPGGAGGPGARGNSAQYGGYEEYEESEMNMEDEMSGYEDDGA
ncbi:MAG: hypothetical protein AAFU85_04475 [Planctomycetota bacterium]